MGLGHPFQAPNGYIFDEVYFAQDACKDLVGLDYYDPEPPLAKLAIAAGMVIGGTWMHYDRATSTRSPPTPMGRPRTAPVSPTAPCPASGLGAGG